MAFDRLERPSPLGGQTNSMFQLSCQSQLPSQSIYSGYRARLFVRLHGQTSVQHQADQPPGALPVPCPADRPYAQNPGLNGGPDSCQSIPSGNRSSVVIQQHSGVSSNREGTPEAWPQALTSVAAEQQLQQRSRLLSSRYLRPLHSARSSSLLHQRSWPGHQQSAPGSSRTAGPAGYFLSGTC